MPRFWGGTGVTSSPPITTEPASGCSSPATIRSSVDFPEPDGPSRATSDPSGTSSETSSSAVKPANRFETELTSIIGA